MLANVAELVDEIKCASIMHAAKSNKALLLRSLAAIVADAATLTADIIVQLEAGWGGRVHELSEYVHGSGAQVPMIR